MKFRELSYQRDKDDISLRYKIGPISVVELSLLPKYLLLKMWSKLFLLIFATIVASEHPRTLYDALQDGDDIFAVSPKADPVDGIVYRLPNDTIPLTYDIWLSTDIHLGEPAFQGRVLIRFRVAEPTQEVIVHYHRMTISSVDLLNSDNLSLEENVAFSQNETLEFLVIQPTQQLTVGQEYSVQISYNGSLRDDSLGFYRSSYLDSQGDRVWLATTQFQANNARHAFPW